MNWRKEVLEYLIAKPVCGYQARGEAATEPTSLAALALHGHGEKAAGALKWLASNQAKEGSLGVSSSQSQPRWPTSLAVLAWQTNSTDHGPQITKSLDWILSQSSQTIPRNKLIGHDTTIIAWPWVADTHAWIEPTAMHVLALKASGHGRHNRTRAAVRMLKDRLLPGGGCNCGNTSVFGQVLRPHLMPTGLALLALADEKDDDGRIARSVDYVSREVAKDTGTPSLCYGYLALAAFDCVTSEHTQKLVAVARRTIKRGAAPYKLALIALAALREDSPLVTLR